MAYLWALAALAQGFQTFNPMKVDFTQLNIKTWTGNLEKYRSEDAAQAVLFYTPGQEAKDYVENIYDPLARKLHSVVRMMAIDCEAFAGFCAEKEPSLKFKEGPVVVGYPPLPRPAKVLPIGADAKALTRELVSYIPRVNVKELNAGSFDTFVEDPAHEHVPKVIYFGDKKSASPSFNAIANSMHDRMDFAFVNVHEDGNDKLKTRVLKKTNTPTIAIIKLGKTDVFDGDLSNAETVFNWVNVHAETFVKGGGFSGKAAPEQHWLKEAVPTMSKESNGAICFKQNALCAVYVSPQKELSPSEIKMIESVIATSASNNQKDAKFKFSWFSSSTEEKAASVLGVDGITEPHFLIVNPHKRLRFTTPVTASKDSILKEIDSLREGNQRFTPIKDKKVPTFSSFPTPEAHDEL